jgi:hypothetical protein
MQIHRETSWLLSARMAPVTRFMQDQPICTVAEEHTVARYTTRVAAAFEWASISEEQLAAIEGIMSRKAWVEPPRWRPYAEVITRHHFADDQRQWITGLFYQITACPGTDPEGIRELLAARPPDMYFGLTIGPLHETTKNVDDIRLERTPSERAAGHRHYYTTICRRMVNEARRRGLLIE